MAYLSTPAVSDDGHSLYRLILLFKCWHELEGVCLGLAKIRLGTEEGPELCLLLGGVWGENLDVHRRAKEVVGHDNLHIVLSPLSQ
jgi:hypothetical protein